MTSNLSEEKLAELKAAFDLFDTDQKGIINFQDLNRIFLSLGQELSEEDFKEMIQDVDKDGDHEIGFGEFLDLIVKKMKDNETEEELVETFKTFDKGSKGYFTYFELKSVLSSFGENLTDGEIENIMNDMGMDANGQVYYDEFVKFMSN